MVEEVGPIPTARTSVVDVVVLCLKMSLLPTQFEVAFEQTGLSNPLDNWDSQWVNRLSLSLLVLHLSLIPFTEQIKLLEVRLLSSVVALTQTFNLSTLEVTYLVDIGHILIVLNQLLFVSVGFIGLVLLFNLLYYQQTTVFG